MRVSFNTSTTFLHHLIALEHEDIIVTNRVNDSDKCLNWDKEDDRDLFKNSNIKESDIILL